MSNSAGIDEEDVEDEENSQFGMKLRKRKRKDVPVKRLPGKKIRTVRMTKERLDMALEMLDFKRKPQVSCFRKPQDELPLMSENRILFELQKCADQEDWIMYTKYLLHLGTGRTEKFIHYKHALIGLAYDPVAREYKFLQEFASLLQENVINFKNNTLTPEEAVKRIFSNL